MSSGNPQKSRLRSVLALTAVAVSAALVLAGCSTSSSSGSGDSSSSKVNKISVTLTGGGSDKCAVSSTSVPAGPVTFTVENKSSTGITEVELLQEQKILGEKENLAPGLAKSSFTVTLGGGKYQVYCPGATKELTDFTVTGKAAAASNSSAATLLRQGAKQYATYVDDQVTTMVATTKALQTAVDSGNLTDAQTAYAKARPYYERVESDVDGFVKPGFKATDNAGNLDYLIDMRASNLDPKVGWHGYHAVERDLFQSKAITASTKTLAAELTSNVEELSKLVPSLSYKPEDLANGAAGLLEEVQTEKVTGEEEAFSHIDLVDLAANVEGAEEAFAYMRPGLQKLDPSITKAIAAQFTKTDALLDTYRSSTGLGGFITYDAATKAKDANTISQQVQALQDPLSQLAAKVATA
ncbi:iron uptake system protein EfeO [Frondihabitans australicus]|uniref:Iron uptake system component EfeO n=1 Tax=Frondihabitans australicus TaxID=386892 RepID=A0A495IGT0_9MICO|nr:iron uptake system protein EfeO [Frondihabitans australicus]RKR75212.1 iron uptake system component EfeO [Frondihabitans australicus]